MHTDKNRQAHIKKHKGFTLLELMVAIGIFAVVSLLAMGGMSHVMTIQKESQTRLDDLNRLQMFFQVFDREITHLVNRPVRGEYGLQLSALSSTTSDAVDGIEFTHQGRMIPGQSYSLQRVAYYIEGEQLYKKIWPVLDRAEDTPSYQQIVLNDVTEFNIRYLIETSPGQMEWQESVYDSSQLRGIRIDINRHNNNVYRIFSVHS